MCALSAPTEKIVAPNPDRPSAFSQRVGDVLSRSVVRMRLLVEADRKRATCPETGWSLQGSRGERDDRCRQLLRRPKGQARLRVGPSWQATRARRAGVAGDQGNGAEIEPAGALAATDLAPNRDDRRPLHFSLRLRALSAEWTPALYLAVPDPKQECTVEPKIPRRIPWQQHRGENTLFVGCWVKGRPDEH